MKVALLTPTFSGFSGIDRLVEQKAQELSAGGDKVTVFCFSADIRPRSAALIVWGMPSSPFLQRLFRLFFFLYAGRVNRCVSALKGFDVAMSFFYPMNVVASSAKRRFGLKYVYYNAGIAYPWLFGFFESVYLRIFNHLTNRSLSNVDSVISISDFLRKRLLAETGIDSIVEHVKIDSRRFNPGVGRKLGTSVRKRLGIPGKSKVLLYVGRISPHKGLHLLLKSFSLVLKHFPDARLVVVGKHTFGGYSKLLKRVAPDSVIFAGYVPDEELPGFYAACDLYVTGSLWEGFDIPIVEANACGKKAVAFDVGSHGEVLKSGSLVEPGNIAEFAGECVRLLK